MVPHSYSLAEIVGWLLHGIVQWALYLIPVLRPYPEPGPPPMAWYRWRGWSDWYYNLDAQQRPNQTWLEYWSWMGWGSLGIWVDEIGEWARDRAVALVRQFTGYVSFGHATFQVWLTALRRRAGTWVPHWATDLADAAHRLYHLFPRVIRYRWQTWDQLFEDIAAGVRAWALARYDLARARALAVFDWFISTGQAIAAWWREVRWWVDNFRRNPASYIAGQLGPTWLRLAAFARLALDYYSSLWSYHAQDLADFLADPGGWLWDKLEAEIVRRW